MMAARLLLSGLLFLILAASAWAQAPRVANAPFASTDALRINGDPVPDTTDWHAYFPLDLGNAWQYERIEEYPGGNSFTFIFGYEVIGDTIVGGRPYALIRECNLRVDGTLSCSGQGGPIGYSEEHAYLFYPDEFNGEPYDAWWQFVPCRLDAPFNTETECTGLETPLGNEQAYEVYGFYGATLNLPPDQISGVTYKVFDSLGGDRIQMASGFGPIYKTFEADQTIERLVWARIGGEEYGTPEFFFPTAEEPEPLSPARAGITELYPNPVRERLTLAFRAAEPATVEVIDVLGRVVRRQEVEWRGPEQGVLHIDARGLRAGAYLVRVRTESGASVTRTVTKL